MIRSVPIIARVPTVMEVTNVKHVSNSNEFHIIEFVMLY